MADGGKKTPISALPSQLEEIGLSMAIFLNYSLAAAAAG